MMNSMNGSERRSVRIAAVGDLHCGRESQGRFQALFAQIAQQADVLALCGDLTDYGLPEEAHILCTEIGHATKIPMVAVLGNHDYESGRQHEVRDVFAQSGVTVLDGDAFEVSGVGFAGVKGFGGGFDDRALQPWGEEVIKRFVREGVDEAVKLESAIAKLRTPQRIVLLHYAPVRATAAGEPLEIMPFLGTSRLEEPINRYSVTAAFHGHAHYGTAQGTTARGVPVYNVALPLLRRVFPEAPPFRVLELPLEPAPAHTDGSPPAAAASHR